MFKRFFALACLSLAILPGCSNSNQKSGDITVEEPQYKEKISYTDGMVTQIELCDYENGLRTFAHSKRYSKTGKIQSEMYEEIEYRKKQAIRSNITLTDYTDEPVQIATGQSAVTYDSHGNIVHSVSITTYSDESLTVNEVAVEYKYDSRGNILEETVYEMNTNNLSNSDSSRGYIKLKGYRTVTSYDERDRIVNSLYYELSQDEYYEPEFELMSYTHCTYKKNKATSLTYYYENMLSNDSYIVRKAIITELYNNSGDLIEYSEYLYNQEEKITSAVRHVYEYGQNHCVIHEIDYTASSERIRISKEVFTSYLNNNPNKILIQNTIALNKSFSLVNEYDSKGRIVKSATNSVSGKKTEQKTEIYKY